MTLFQALVLGLLQGATEFIPVSSSGHLTLVPWLLHWSFDPDLKFAFDVMAHWGTLFAVLAVFWSDWWALARGWLRTVGVLPPARDEAPDEGRGGAAAAPPGASGTRSFWARVRADADGRLAWLILIGSIPAAVLGLLLENFFEMLFGTPPLVSILLLVTAGLLALSEWRGKKGREVEDLGATSVGSGYQAMVGAIGVQP